MGMLSVSDLSVAMGGKTFSSAESLRAEHYIDRITSYIEGETDITFGTITGAVLRKRSNDAGEIEFSEWPIVAISLIHDVKKDYDVDFTDHDLPWTPWFNGVDTIYRLRAKRIYDITMDYGLDPVPYDIKGVAVDAVIRGLNTSLSGLKSRTVGDVTEQFGTMMDFPPGDLRIIDNYSEENATWRTTSNVFQAQYGEGYRGIINGPTFWEDEC